MKAGTPIFVIHLFLFLAYSTASAGQKTDTSINIKDIRTPVIANGEDWSLPSFVEPLAGTGFFSEELAPLFDVHVRSIDVSWRQLNPSQGVYQMSGTGSAQGMNFGSLQSQLASSDPFWMRIWASGVDWAPEWVVSDCGITETWEDYDGQFHIPIWDPCVWNHLMDLYRQVFITWNLRADPRMIMLYAPGAFTWCEFDYEIIEQAAASGLTFSTFNTWFQSAMPEMVDIFNGENQIGTDDYAHKIVFTGEDYPWGPWDGQANLLARDAVVAGCGIRTGITEVFNFHLNHTPAYGSTITTDGHILTDESWPLLLDGRVIATENECFNDCGFTASDPYFAVKMANLKALQLRVNWLYVVPVESYMAEYSEHWAWVRHSLGRQPASAPDAWVALREFQDLYWVDDESHNWTGKPWIHNFERWLVQKDVGTDGQTRRGSEVRVNELSPENGTSYEGRQTDHVAGQDYMYFFVDDLFMSGRAPIIDIKVTFRDMGTAQWVIEYETESGMTQTPAIQNMNSGTVKTATFTIPDAVFSGNLPNSSDFRIFNGGSEDIELKFVRIIRGAALLPFEDWPEHLNILAFIQMMGAQP